MPNDDIHFLELLEIGRQIQSRARSSVEVTRTMLDRIQTHDGRLNSYATVMAQQASAQAARADDEIRSGQARGPLHGVPIAVKDLLWTTDAPTSHGMTIHAQFAAPEDATVVSRLRHAGAVILGKLRMTEGAFGAHHPRLPVPVNPWNASLWPGVSSSGSGVATAAGLCFGSVGTDTGGSIRFPSAANGLTGIKPTYGRVSRYGAFALAASMDHIGPMTRSAADAAAMLQVMAGPDPKDPTAEQRPVPDYLALMSHGLAGLTVGVDHSWMLDPVDAPTKAVLQDVMARIEQLGGRIQDIAFPGEREVPANWAMLCAVETAIAHEATFPSRRDEYGPALAGIIDLGLQTQAIDYQKLQLMRNDFRGRMNRVFADVDLVLAPATPRSAMTGGYVDECLADPELLTSMLSYTAPLDMSGHPTITLPGGRTSDGAPIGFQFIAPHFGEHLLVRAGWAYQRVTDWHRQHPAV